MTGNPSNLSQNKLAALMNVISDSLRPSLYFVLIGSLLLIVLGCEPNASPTSHSTTTTSSNGDSDATDERETVTVPTSIDGPDWSYVIQEPETYTPTGATTGSGHKLEYRIDWGDGHTSDWTTTGAGHNWKESGDYELKAQARCQEHPDDTSEWSDPLITVEVTWE